MKKRKPLIITGILLIAVVTAVIIGAEILGNYIEGELQNRQIGNYQTKSNKSEVNVFLRQITIYEIVAEDSAANHQLTVAKIKATGIHIFPLIFNDKLIINNLHIQQPVLAVMQRNSDEEDQQQEDDYLEQEKEIEQIHIKHLEITDASALLQKPSSGNADTLLFLEAGLEFRNLNIFSDREQLKFKNNSAENLHLIVRNAEYNLPGGLYRLQFDSLEYSTEQETLNLWELHFSSLHSKYDIAKQTGAETDWYDITLPGFKMEGININSLLQDTAVVFRSAVLEGLNAAIFRDKRLPFPDKPDSKLPMEMLDGLPVRVYSDSILIKDAVVAYEEHSEESSESGRVTFNRLYATIYNLGTIKDSIEGQTAMSVRAVVMNESLLKVDFVFPNNQYSYQYKVSGSMEPVSLTTFNPILVPSAFVRIEEGRINRLDFDFTYDDTNSEGSLSLEYENLKINLLDKEDGSEKQIKTFITETFVLNKENLKEKNSYQKGTISAEREKKKSIFSYWWKSLFSGIKDVLAF